MAGVLQTQSLQPLRTSQSALIGRMQECCAHTFPVYIQTKGSRDFHHSVQAQTGSVGFGCGLKIQYDEGGCMAFFQLIGLNCIGGHCEIA